MKESPAWVNNGLMTSRQSGAINDVDMRGIIGCNG